MVPQEVQNLLEIREDNRKMKLTIDCQHHLHNVLTNYSSVKLCNHVKLELEEDSRDNDLHLSVKVDMGSIIRSIDKVLTSRVNTLREMEMLSRHS